MTSIERKLRLFAVLCLSVLAVAGPAQRARGQGTKRTLPPALQTLKEVASPGVHHKSLDALVGTWDATAQYWLMAGQPPAKASGTVETRWILGGRFIEQHIESRLWGERYEGKGVIGYDNHAGKYVGTWVDTMATFVLHYEGTCSTDCKVLTMEARFIDPVSEQEVKNRSVITIVDASTYKYESYLVFEGGQQLKHVEILAQRRRAPGR